MDSRIVPPALKVENLEETTAERAPLGCHKQTQHLAA